MSCIQGSAHTSSPKSHAGSPKSRSASPKPNTPAPVPNGPISHYINAKIKPNDTAPTYHPHETHSSEILAVFERIRASGKAKSISDISYRVGESQVRNIKRGTGRFTPSIHKRLYEYFGSELVPDVLPYVDYEKDIREKNEKNRQNRIETNTKKATNGSKSPVPVFARLAGRFTRAGLVAQMNQPGISVNGKPYITNSTSIGRKINRDRLFEKEDVKQAIAVGLVNAEDIIVPSFSKKRSKYDVESSPSPKRLQLSGPSHPLYPHPPYPDQTFSYGASVTGGNNLGSGWGDSSSNSVFQTPANSVPHAPHPGWLQSMNPQPQHPGPQAVSYGTSMTGHNAFGDIDFFNVPSGGSSNLVGDSLNLGIHPAFQPLAFNNDSEMLPFPSQVSSTPVSNAFEVSGMSGVGPWYVGVSASGSHAGMNLDFTGNDFSLRDMSATMPLSGHELHPDIPFFHGALGLRETGTYYGMADSNPEEEASQLPEEGSREA